MPVRERPHRRKPHIDRKFDERLIARLKTDARFVATEIEGHWIVNYNSNVHPEELQKRQRRQHYRKEAEQQQIDSREPQGIH